MRIQFRLAPNLLERITAEVREYQGLKKNHIKFGLKSKAINIRETPKSLKKLDAGLEANFALLLQYSLN
jgi:hypothetical protein